MLAMAIAAGITGIQPVKAVPDIDPSVLVRLDELDAGNVDKTVLPRNGQFDEIIFHGLTNLRFGKPKVRKNTARPSMAFKVWHPNTGRASLNKNE